MLLAISKMNILHDYGIVFDGKDNINNWDREFPFGCTVADDLTRAVYKTISRDNDPNFTYSEYSGTDLAYNSCGDKALEWDSSCGVTGFYYAKNSKFDDTASASIEVLSELMNFGTEKPRMKKKRTEIRDEDSMSNPWTWEGAPEFKDWTFHGSLSTEFAFLQ